MLNETASSQADRPFIRATIPEEPEEDQLADQLRQMVAQVMEIERSVTGGETPANRIPPIAQMFGGGLSARFVGRLRINSEQAYEQLDTQFKTVNHTPMFRIEDNRHVILALAGRVEPQPRPWWPNLILFIATLFSVLLVGTELAIQAISLDTPFLAQRMIEDPLPELWRGFPYAISIMLILGAHELGHYFAARRHNLAVTLPYFIPLPLISPFGTLGAFIQLRQPMRNRKVLLDVGAAGPLAGLVFALPILFIGLAQARVAPITGGGLYEGDSLIYAFAKIVTFGEFLPNGVQDVIVNSSQLAWAGWTGLLVSALNLIPIGQLDGGHILYSLLGERARWLYYPVLLAMILLVFVTDVWLLWVILLLLFGRVYATPLDMITPLNQPRRWVAIASLVIFALIFVPTPLSPNPHTPATPSRSAMHVAPQSLLASLLRLPQS